MLPARIHVVQPATHLRIASYSTGKFPKSQVRQPKLNFGHRIVMNALPDFQFSYPKKGLPVQGRGMPRSGFCIIRC